MALPARELQIFSKDDLMSLFLKEKLLNLSCKNIVIKLIIALTAVSLFETAFSPYDFDTAEFFNSISFGLHIFATVYVFVLLFLILDEKHDGLILIFLLKLSGKKKPKSVI